MPKEKPEPSFIGLSTINALFISLDKNLLADPESQALARHRRFAKYFNSLNIIVLSLRKDHLREKRYQDNLRIIPTSSISRWMYVWDALKLTRYIIRKGRIDVVSAQDPFITGLIAIVIKKKFDIPVNIQIHNDYFSDSVWAQESLENRLFLILGKYIIRRADSVRVVSRRIARSLLSILHHKVLLARIPVVPIKLFWKPADQKKPIDVISVGRLDPQKDYGKFLKIMKGIVNQYPRLNAVVLGDGSQRQVLERQNKLLGLTQNVKFLGKVTAKEVAALLRNAKLFVLSSKYEGLSMALEEAMIVGIPAVVSDVSGTDELVENGVNGFRVKGNHEQQFVQRILELLTDDEKRRMMGEQSRIKAEQFLKRDWGAEWATLLEQTAVKSSYTMKRANIEHYAQDIEELGKPKWHASKKIFFPKLLGFIKQYISDKDTIIDVGGGAGVLMTMLNAEMPLLNIVGIDISIEMTKMRKKIGLNKNLIGDMDRLPVRSTSVDSVVFLSALHHTPNTEKAIQESYRILRPGGCLLLAEYNSFRYLFYPGKQGAIPSPGDPRECLINHYMLTKMLRKEGFRIEHESLHRQLVTIVEFFIRNIPVPLYRLLVSIEEKLNNVPVFKEIGSLMLIAARKPYE